MYNIVWNLGYFTQDDFWQELTGIEHRTLKGAEKELKYYSRNHNIKDLRIDTIGE